MARASSSHGTDEPTNTLKTLPKHHANPCHAPDIASSGDMAHRKPLPTIGLRQSVRVIVRHARSLKPDRRRAQRVEQLDISRAERTWQLNHQKGCSLRTAPLWGIRAIPLPLPCPRLPLPSSTTRHCFTFGISDLPTTRTRWTPSLQRPHVPAGFTRSSPCRLSSLPLRRAVGNDPSLLVT